MNFRKLITIILVLGAVQYVVMPIAKNATAETVSLAGQRAAMIDCIAAGNTDCK